MVSQRSKYSTSSSLATKIPWHGTSRAFHFCTSNPSSLGAVLQFVFALQPMLPPPGVRPFRSLAKQPKIPPTCSMAPTFAKDHLDKSTMHIKARTCFLVTFLEPPSPTGISTFLFQPVGLFIRQERVIRGVSRGCAASISGRRASSQNPYTRSNMVYGPGSREVSL